MKRSSRLAGLGTFTLVALCATAAHAEGNHLWPRFAVSAGAYEVSSDNEIRLDGTLDAVAGGGIDFARDFGLPDSESVLALELDWAFANRHSVDIAYGTVQRGGSRSLSRQIEIGGIVFPIAASASADFDTTTIEAAYTYWFVRKDGLGVGGSFGLVDLAVDTELSASAQLAGSGGTVSKRVTASTDLPVPMIGIEVKGSPLHRLVLYGNGRFLPSVTVGDYDGRAGVYSVGGEFYLVGPVALGLSWDGSYYEADVDKSGWHGSLDLVSDGVRAYLRLGF